MLNGHCRYHEDADDRGDPASRPAWALRRAQPVLTRESTNDLRELTNLMFF